MCTSVQIFLKLFRKFSKLTVICSSQLGVPGTCATKVATFSFQSAFFDLRSRLFVIAESCVQSLSKHICSVLFSPTLQEHCKLLLYAVGAQPTPLTAPIIAWCPLIRNSQLYKCWVLVIVCYYVQGNSRKFFILSRGFSLVGWQPWILYASCATLEEESYDNDLMSELDQEQNTTPLD